jgi:GGDEF domain-containing protein
MVCRLGGDEFVAVLPMLSDDKSSASVTAREVAEKLRLALNQPLVLEGHEYIATPSIGIVLFPTQGITADDVLKVVSFKKFCHDYELKSADSTGVPHP